MAEKSALIASVLNSTAASEFFTQDIEDDVPVNAPTTNQKPEPPYHSTPTPKAAPTPTGTQSRATPAIAPKQVNKAPYRHPESGVPMTEEQMDKYHENCKKAFLEHSKEWLMAGWIWAVEAGYILPTEELSAIRAEVVPHTSEEFGKVSEAVDAVIQSGKCEDSQWLEKFNLAYDKPPFDPPAPHGSGGPDEPQCGPNEPEAIATETDEEWWRNQKLPPYNDRAQTIGDLTKSKSGMRTLYGWAKNYVPGKSKNGKEFPITPDDLRFREALDAAAAAHNFK